MLLDRAAKENLGSGLGQYLGDKTLASLVLFSHLWLSVAERKDEKEEKTEKARERH